MDVTHQRCFSLNILWHIPNNWDWTVSLCYWLRCLTFEYRVCQQFPTGLMWASCQLLFGAPCLFNLPSQLVFEGWPSRTHAVCAVVILCVFCLGQWASRLFQPVQYGQKPEGRTVAFPSTHPPRMATTNAATAAPQGQVRGRPPIATFSANPDAKGILHNQSALSFERLWESCWHSLFLAYLVL